MLNPILFLVSSCGKEVFEKEFSGKRLVGFI